LKNWQFSVVYSLKVTRAFLHCRKNRNYQKETPRITMISSDPHYWGFKGTIMNWAIAIFPWRVTWNYADSPFKNLIFFKYFFFWWKYLLTCEEKLSIRVFLKIKIKIFLIMLVLPTSWNKNMILSIMNLFQKYEFRVLNLLHSQFHTFLRTIQRYF